MGGGEADQRGGVWACPTGSLRGRAPEQKGSSAPRRQGSRAHCHCASHLTPTNPSAQVLEKGEQLTPLHSISQLTFGAGRNKGHERTTNY